MVKDAFLHNDGQRNACVRICHMFKPLKFIERTSPKLSCVNIWQHGLKCAFEKVITLKGQGHRSKEMAPSDSLTSKTKI